MVWPSCDGKVFSIVVEVALRIIMSEGFLRMQKIGL